MTLSVEDVSADIHAVCTDCGWLSSSDDPDFAEADAVEHATTSCHSVQVVSKFVQVYAGTVKVVL